MKKINFHFLLLFILVALSSTSFGQPGTTAKAMLNHIALYVVELEKSTAFYQQVIGLDTIPEPFHDGKHTWFSIGLKVTCTNKRCGCHNRPSQEQPSLF